MCCVVVRYTPAAWPLGHECAGRRATSSPQKAMQRAHASAREEGRGNISPATNPSSEIQSVLLVIAKTSLPLDPHLFTGKQNRLSYA